ncbi:MAG: type II secretion system protein [Candidatus Microsaccharimonas sp.]
MKRVGTAGFTIVELLIVIVVIAILAAITIVSYNGITNQTHDAAVKSDLNTIKKKIDIYIVKNNSRPNSLELTEAVAPFRASKQSYATRPTTDHNLIYCSDTSAPLAYAVVAYSKSGKKFSITGSSGVAEYTNAWTDQVVACQGIVGAYGSNNRGYAAEDTGTGPWRAWVGGN